ncbi:MAG: hypothetical protein CSH37_02415 [Thalassolituus sp.]|nr:hypothetical protein [Pseudomonadota bacterium]MEC8525591.1 hypothetical protein [Pseudomonadota bacterium]TNC86982.1 MAG: hypothetical protein CSH37_02415 [Thalassolituus sp.]
MLHLIGLTLIFFVTSAPALGDEIWAEPSLVPPGIVWPQDTDSLSGDAAQTEVTDDMAERSRRWLVDHLDNLSGGIDSFFVDRFFNDDVTDIQGQGSHAKFSFFTRRELGDPVDYKFGVSMNIELPHTNDRLNLLLQSEDEDVRESQIFESPDNVTYSSALRFIIQQSERWSSSVDAGVRWGIPPDPFIRLRARRPVYFDYWNLNLRQELNYYTSDGYGSVTDLTFDRPIDTQRLFRLETEAEYLLNNDYFTLMYGGGLYHEINPIYAYAVLARATGDSEFGPTFDAYEFGVRVRRRVYHEWMFAEIQPQYVWTRENEWKPTPVIMFRLQAEFRR